MENDISQRKTKILHAVIDDYITNAEPVSSQEIRDNHLPELSSATIRSELSALEDMGYLVKPHVSAGRVPSAKAYKYYVDKLMKEKPLSGMEMKHIKEYLDGRVGQVEDLVRRTAKIVTDVTHYTSVILLNSVDKVKVKTVRFVDLTEGSVMIVIVTDSGIIRDSIVEMSSDMPQGYLDIANSLINNAFAGRLLGDIISDKDSLVTEELSNFRNLFDSVVDVIKKYAEKSENVFLEGSNKILEYPEYNDVTKAKNLLAAIDTKEKLYEIMNEDNGIEFDVKIDKANNSGIEDCSVVTAKYKIGGKEVGHIGVIGPTRMKYDKVFSVLKYISKTLNEK